MPTRAKSTRALRHLAVVAALSLGALPWLQGCAQPPVYTAVNHQRVVPLAAPDVWRRLHGFLLDQGIHIVSEDPGAGILDAQQAVAGKGLLGSYADCGQGVDLLHTLQRQTLDLTIRVTPTPEGSQVIANAAFSQTLRARRAGVLTVACRSNGVLEDAVLNVASGQPMQAAPIPQ